MIRGFRFRIYPTAAKLAVLEAWTDGLRFLWNLAHQQRLMGLQTVRDRGRYYSSYDQINELTELRAQAPWIAAVPRNVAAQLLMELNKAWRNAFRRLAGPPHFKKRWLQIVCLLRKNSPRMERPQTESGAGLFRSCKRELLCLNRIPQRHHAIAL